MRASSALFGLCLLLFATVARGADAPLPANPRDAYLQGALDVVFERMWGWGPQSYAVTVHDGVATVTFRQASAERRRRLDEKLPHFDGLTRVRVVVSPPPAAEAKRAPAAGPTGVRARVYSFLGVKRETEPFPVGDLFLPLLADPKQPQFFTSYRIYHTPSSSAHAAAVGYGETFGFYRRPGVAPGDGLQVGVAGALFAQFNLDAPSADLINADYTIGLPITWRHGADSARLRLYHQSSHLGDEYLLRAQPKRVNLSFESLEFIYSHEWPVWRAYFGGEYLFHREPSDLRPAALHAGVEFRTSREVWGTAHWVGGLDLKSWQEHRWAVDRSLKVGLEFGAERPGERRVRLMLEGYRGYAPHGQFYDDKISYYGLGLYLGF